jgi:hypothetical protein
MSSTAVRGRWVAVLAVAVFAAGCTGGGESSASTIVPRTSWRSYEELTGHVCGPTYPDHTELAEVYLFRPNTQWAEVTAVDGHPFEGGPDRLMQPDGTMSWLVDAELVGEDLVESRGLRGTRGNLEIIEDEVRGGATVFTTLRTDQPAEYMDFGLTFSLRPDGTWESFAVCPPGQMELWTEKLASAGEAASTADALLAFIGPDANPAVIEDLAWAEPTLEQVRDADLVAHPRIAPTTTSGATP